jgi:16S rRNA (adenine1518-N6/adenine1519-N6)-dimethyltransferase
LPNPRQTLSYLSRRLAAAGVRPRLQYGQNFLIDLNLLELLFDTAQIGPDDVVLEVGAGTGALSAMLASLAGAVVSVEIDRQLAQIAREELALYDNATLLVQDALKNKNRLHPTVLDAVRARLAEAPGRRFKLVANLPYNIATPVISNLLAHGPVPETMTVTIQMELAERIASPPNTRDYSALSVWVQSQCQVRIVRSIPPSAFWPRPKVTSAILQITFDPALRSRIQDLDFFHQFVRSMFFHRRKVLRSELRAAYREQFGKSEVDAILASQGLTGETRAEQLSIEQMIALADEVRRRLPSDATRHDSVQRD